jgi:1-acyl-sn-glycerol-3-phosphate acyltransferase
MTDLDSAKTQQTIAHAAGVPAPTMFGRFLYRLGHFFFSAVFRCVWRLRIHGRENIPLEGGLIFASNHLSMADPPLVGCSVPRMIYFMAKQELFEIPGFGWLIRQVNAFPLRRAERDVGAFKTAQRILTSGGALILFPEGHRQRDGVMKKPKAGVGMLAVTTGCRVVPVYIHDTHRIWRFPRLAICFGRPIEAQPKQDYQEFSNKVMAAVAALKETYCGSAN